MKFKHPFWLFIFIPFLLNGQPVLPEKGMVFNDADIPIIYVTIETDSLEQLWNDDNLLSNHEYPADFTWDDGIHVETIQNIGFRLRGNSSRLSAKKSFKIKFDHFGSGSFHGLEELNINGEHNDPSIIRSKLCFDLMRLANIEAPRCNHVALYINDKYMGLYINVESIDKIFLSARQKNPDGQLFKCNYGADMVYRGNYANQYPKDIYEPANNKSAVDYESFTRFLKALNDTNNPDYRCKLEEVFDVDDYLKRLAIEILTGHWDNPVYNKNNAYLYFNPVTRKCQLLSYDMDNTFGIDWFNIKWSDRDIFKWSKSGQPRPIYDIIKHIPEYRQRLAFYVRKFSLDYFNQTFIQQHVNPIRNKIVAYRADDPYAPLDYGYTLSDFLISYQSGVGGHVKNGLYEYVQLRSISALAQAGIPNPSPIINYPEIKNHKDTAEILFRIENTGPLTGILHYRLGQEEWKAVNVYDDGTGNDAEAHDEIYQYKIPVSGRQTLSYYITAEEDMNKQSRLPVCGQFETAVGRDKTPYLIINEFMADNTIFKDNAGETEDWIEIYNASNEVVNLNSLYLTDKADRPDKWKMPDITLAPGEFTLFWADEDQNQGSDHTNFKLGKEGEFLGIFENQDILFNPVDTFSFGQSVNNVSYGRYPDGTGPVIQLPSLTPGKSNLVSATHDSKNNEININPNPFHSRPVLSFFSQKSENITFSVLDTNGKLVSSFELTVAEGKNNIELPAEIFKNSGLYYVDFSLNGKQQKVRLVKMQ